MTVLWQRLRTVIWVVYYIILIATLLRCTSYNAIFSGNKTRLISQDSIDLGELDRSCKLDRSRKLDQRPRGLDQQSRGLNHRSRGLDKFRRFITLLSATAPHIRVIYHNHTNVVMHSMRGNNCEALISAAKITHNFFRRIWENIFLVFLQLDIGSGGKDKCFICAWINTGSEINDVFLSWFRNFWGRLHQARSVG